MNINLNLTIDGKSIKRFGILLGMLLVVGLPVFVFASNVPAFTDFQNGEIIDANALNTKFNDLRDAVNDNDARIGKKHVLAVTLSDADTVDGTNPTPQEATNMTTDFTK